MTSNDSPEWAHVDVDPHFLLSFVSATSAHSAINTSFGRTVPIFEVNYEKSERLRRLMIEAQRIPKRSFGTCHRNIFFGRFNHLRNGKRYPFERC